MKIAVWVLSTVLAISLAANILQAYGYVRFGKAVTCTQRGQPLVRGTGHMVYTILRKSSLLLQMAMWPLVCRITALP